MDQRLVADVLDRRRQQSRQQYATAMRGLGFTNKVEQAAGGAMNLQKERIVPNQPGPQLRAAILKLRGPCQRVLAMIEALTRGEATAIDPNDFRALEAAIMDEHIRGAYSAEPKERAKLGVQRWAKSCFTHDCRYAIALDAAWQAYERWAQAFDYGTCWLKFAALSEAEHRSRALWLFGQLLTEAGITPRARGYGLDAPAYIWGVISSPEPEQAAETEPASENAEFPVVDRRRIMLGRDALGRFLPAMR